MQLNSYQAVIASNGKTSYVILIYDRVEWSSPDSTGVAHGSGLGAMPSQLPVLGISDGFSDEQLIDTSPRDESTVLNVEMSPGNTRFGTKGLWIFEASASRSEYYMSVCMYVVACTDLFLILESTIQSSPLVDPKIQYSEYHRPSRPYVSPKQQALDEIESELKYQRG